MKTTDYLLRTYDTYFQDVRREHIGRYANDETAIQAAKQICFLLHPLDSVEIQVCRKGLGMCEWVMFAAVFYDDGEFAVEDCFC